jgi:predicted chitinase
MFDRDFFFKSIKNTLIPHPTQGQVDGINALLDVWEDKFSDKPKEFLAYCLATTFHETASTMQPIKEYGQGRHKAYGVATGLFHQVYFGRGDVQLTWLANYSNAQNKLNKDFNIDIDIVKNADNALDPKVAAIILFAGSIEGWFTGKKLSDYFTPKSSDAIHARKIINGLDCSVKIANYFKVFEEALKNKV